MSRVPVKPREPKVQTVTVPRELVETTLDILIQAPAQQVYLLLQAWEQAIPDIFKRIEAPSGGNGLPPS